MSLISSKLLGILFLLFFLSACGPKIQSTVKVVEKYTVEARTEITPPGYRLDCGLSLDAKVECGYKYFTDIKVNYFPEEYYFILLKEDCEFHYQTDKDSYTKYNKDSTISLEVESSRMGECYLEKKVK